MKTTLSLLLTEILSKQADSPNVAMSHILAKEELMKKRRRQTGKERFTMHASLCGGGDLLKAPGSEASYLADRLLNLSNDSRACLLVRSCIILPGYSSRG